MSDDNHDSTGAMAHAWFGTPMGASRAVERVFPTSDVTTNQEPVIVGYVHRSNGTFMPVEIFAAWRDLRAAPGEVAEWGPVAWVPCSPPALRAKAPANKSSTEKERFEGSFRSVPYCDFRARFGDGGAYEYLDRDVQFWWEGWCARADSIPTNDQIVPTGIPTERVVDV